jgi:hypothetical protein
LYRITGTEVYVYATTDNSGSSGTSKIGLELNGVRGNDYTTNPGEGPLFNNLIFSATNLERKQHTVQMTSLSDTTWFLDYIVYKTGNDGGGGDGGGDGDGGGSGSNIGAIVGGIIGGVAFLGVLGVLFFFFLRRRRSQQKGEKEHGGYQSVPLAPTGRKDGSNDNLPSAIPTPFIIQPSPQSPDQSPYNSMQTRGSSKQTHNLS